MNLGKLEVSAVIETSGVKQGANTVVNELGKVNNATLNQIKTIGQLTAGYFALVPAIKQFTNESVKAYLESETASKTLLAALKGNQQAFKELSDEASDLQTKTIFSDEQIMGAQAMFGFMGKNSEEIKKLIPLVLNLGAAQERTGNGTANLTAITKTLARSTGEELGPRLEMLIGPLTENEKQMLKNADGMDRINLLTEIMTKRFGDIAFQVDDTASQMKILANRVDEFKEGFGKGLVESVNKGVDALGRIIDVNKKTGISFNDLGYIISKALIGPIMNVVDLLGWLEEKYSDTLNGIQQKVVDFVAFLQGNPVFKYLPGISDINLDDFRTTGADSQTGVNGVVGTGEGDRGKMYNSDFVKKKKDGTGSNKGSDKTPEEQLTFLDEFRKKIKQLEADEKSLTEQLQTENLTIYEQTALLAELTRVQNELNAARGNMPLDVSGKTGDLDVLRDLVFGGKDDNKYGTAIEPNKKERAGQAGQTAGVSFEQMIQAAQNIHNILNQPLDNPFKVMQAMLQIAMQIGSLLGGAGGAAGGALSFLGPIGMGIGLVGSIFGGLFGFSRRSGSGGGSGNMQRMAGMINNYRQTGSIYNLPREFTSGAGMTSNMNMGTDIYINGRPVDGKFKKEVVTDGMILKDFHSRKRSKS